MNSWQIVYKFVFILFYIIIYYQIPLSLYDYDVSYIDECIYKDLAKSLWGTKCIIISLKANVQLPVISGETAKKPDAFGERVCSVYWHLGVEYVYSNM